jgi:methionyl-tRNA formyltransferase
MDILVFLSKTTGFKCLQWLLAAYPDDNYTIFISEPDKKLIAHFLDQKNIAYHDLANADPLKITEGKNYDWLVNIWGAYIFRKDILSRVKNSMNLHPSYLPYGRGRDPVCWAIQDGVSAGASLHQITEGIDEGPIWAQVEIPYAFPVKGEDLYDQVEKACVKLFSDTWPQLREGKLKPRNQGKAPRPARRRQELLTDKQLSMDDPATAQIVNKINAHDFAGNGYTALLKNGEKTYSIRLELKEIEND